LTVGELRDWLLVDEATPERLAGLAPGLTPEMAAAVSKLMRVQDLIAAAAKIRVVTRFRTTVGLPGRLSARLQPNHPTDDAMGIAASILDGLAAWFRRCSGRHQSCGRQRGRDDSTAAA
jgi:ethanolamine ammonia-lyase large subunit